MRRFWFCFLVMAGLICVPVWGAAPGIEWEMTYGEEEYDAIYGMVPLGGGGILFCGETTSSHPDAHGMNDLWFGEVSDTGSLDGQMFYGGTDYDWGYAICDTTDGGWILAGDSASDDGDVGGNNGWRDIWVVKLNPDRTIAWEQNLGGASDEYVKSIIQTAHGGYLVTGKTNSAEMTGDGYISDAYVAELQPDGTPDWAGCYGGSGPDGALDAIETPCGYLIRGYTESPEIPGYHDDRDLWLMHITKLGGVDWERCYGGSDIDIYSQYDFGKGLISCPDGYLVLATTKSTDGDISVPLQGWSDVWILKIAPDGSILDQTAIGGERHEHIGTIRTASGGGYILACTTCSPGGDVTGKHGADDGNADIWVVRLASDLSIVWQRCLGGSYDEFAYDVCEIKPGVFEIVGNTRLAGEEVGGTATPTPEFPGMLVPGVFLALVGGLGLCLRRRV